MKTCIAYLLIVFLLPLAAGCKKDKKVYPTYPPPAWEKQPEGKYAYSMTAVLRLPDNLGTTYSEQDELAAFIGEECRSVAEPVEVNGVRLFYLLIEGDASENQQIVFKYYNAASSYQFVSAAAVEFKADGNYGTADQPRILVLHHL